MQEKIPLAGETPATKRFFEKVSDSILNGEDLAYEREYWGQRESLSLAKKIVENNIPVLLWAGWKDVVETGTVRAYTALQNAYAGRAVGSPMIKGQKTSPRYQIIMGGWAHGEGLDMGLMLQWFDTWIKGTDTGIQNTETPMHVFESGTDRWINLKGFTEVEEATKLKFGNNLTLGANSGNGEDTLKYAQPDEKNGKLVYTSEPFEKGATISGAMSAIIYAKSNNQNIVLIGHLYDVAPDGNEELVTRGAMIGSLRELNKDNSWVDKNGVVIWPWLALKKDSLLKPNQTYKFDLALAPRQYGIKPGHKLKLEITTQTSKKLGDENGIPLTNDTEPWGLTKTQEKTVLGGEYKIVYGRKNPSALNLSLLPYEYFKEVKSGKLSAPWNEGFRRIQEPEGDTEKFNIPLEW